WNLRGGEGDHVVRRIVTEIHVEIVEVAARGAQDDDFARLRHGLGSRRECKAFLGFLRRGSMLTLNKVDLGHATAGHHGLFGTIPPTDSKTRSNIAWVRRPVWVFRWLGWYDARSVIGRSCHVPPWRNLGTGDGTP